MANVVEKAKMNRTIEFEGTLDTPTYSAYIRIPSTKVMQSCNATIRRNPIGRVHGSLQSLQQKHMAQSSECCSPLVTPLVSGGKQGSASSMTMASSASGVKKSSLSNLLGTFHHRKQLAFFAFRFARGRLGQLQISSSPLPLGKALCGLMIT